MQRVVSRVFLPPILKSAWGNKTTDAGDCSPVLSLRPSDYTATSWPSSGSSASFVGNE